MTTTTAFISARPLGRAENITAVWDAYDGPKIYMRVGDGWKDYPDLEKYDTVVCDDFPPLISGRRNVVMLGHGLPMGKTFGLDQPVRFTDRKRTRQITHLISPTEDGEVIATMAGQAGTRACSVLPLGMPRTDAYFKKDPIREEDGISRYLYLPTFRSRYEDPPPHLDWGLVDSLLTDSEELVVKQHPAVKGKLLGNKERSHIREADCYERTEPWIRWCDVAVTDYSSVIFDLYLSRKPVVLYCPDRSSYLEKRGMYMPYPGGYSRWSCSNETDLVETVREARGSFGAFEERLVSKVAGACDGHSSERVAELLWTLGRW